MQKIIVCLLLFIIFVTPISANANLQNQNSLRTEDELAINKENPSKTLLKISRIVYVRSRSAYLKSSLMANALRNRKEFQEYGMVVTDDEMAADLIIEVERAIFTNVFFYRAIDRRSQIVVASGRANSFFGTASGKLAKNFAKQLKKAKES